MNLRRRIGFTPWLCLALSFACICPAQVHDENAVRAAYVFNLAKFVEWPHNAPELTVCFAGNTDMGNTLVRVLSGKTFGGRTIRVLLSLPEQDLSACEILYVDYESEKENQAVVQKVQKLSVLTVGETRGFTRYGGIVGLVRSGDTVQIEANVEAAKEAQLKLSSRLLNLATIVKVPAGRRD